MSDADKAPGEPVEEPYTEQDVVSRANEGLAEAEAAQRELEVDYSQALDPEPVAADPEFEPPAPVIDADPDVATTAYATDAYADAAATEYIAPNEPVAEPIVAPVAAPQPIFVQAPEPPESRGNRAAAGAIGLVAALSFAALYLLAYLAIGLIDRSIEVDALADAAVAALTSWWLWIATAVFFLGFWLFGAIANRGRWGYWVIWGLLMGVVGYGAHIVGQLFQAPFWSLTRSGGIDLVVEQMVAPLAFVAFVIARELTIWYGAWVAARGRRMTELNTEARREYERTLEAGPQLVRQ